MPATTTVASTPAGPLVPVFMTASERSASYDAVSPSATSERPSQCSARDATARAGRSLSPPSQRIAATSAPSGSTATGASSTAPRAVLRVTCRGGATGSAVSVPVASRQASGIGLRVGQQLGEQRDVAQDGDGAAQHGDGGDGAAALAEAQPEVEHRLEAELGERERLGGLGGPVSGGEPRGRTRVDPVGGERARDRHESVE